MEKQYDTIIIGAGVVGLAAAMYTGRLNMKTLVLGTTSRNELPIGGAITLTGVVENYPGFKQINGMELAQKIEEHAREYDIDIKEEKVIEITKDKKSNSFAVKTAKEEYSAKTIILATGARWKELPMKGAKEFERKGVHYCALCDAPLYKNKIVAVIGGSDMATKEALLLAQNAKKVYIIYRKENVRAEPSNIRSIEKNKKIEFITNTNVIEIIGDKFVNKLILDRDYKGSRGLKVDGVFGAIGHEPNSDLAVKLGVNINEKKEIMIDKEGNTNISGVFAAGDVVDSSFKQVITGVAQGVIAAHSAYSYLYPKA
jgi:thioredoxin reductase (NADPH)